MLRAIYLSVIILLVVRLGAATAQAADVPESEEPTETEEILITAPQPQTASSDQMIHDEDFHPKRSASDPIQFAPVLWIGVCRLRQAHLFFPIVSECSFLTTYRRICRDE